MPLLINILAFQIGWFACVLGAAHGMPAMGSLTALAIVGVHLARAANFRSELMLVALSGLIGLLADTLLILFGLIQYASGLLFENIAPHWIVAMWMIFATTLNISFRWLRGRPILAALLGAAAGPLAYAGGSGLGAATFPQGACPGLLGVALVWALAMPALIWISERYDGIARPDAAEP
jgi:hypothetical protein